MASLHERIMELAVSRGFLIPSAEIYGSPAGFYDYGPAGLALKRHIIDAWRRIFIQQNGFVEIETSLIVPEKVLIASGHATNFSDPICDCKTCKQKWRADHLLEKKTGASWAGKTPEELSAGLIGEAIKCPACGNLLGEVGMFNLMFSTSIGAGSENKGYLRPETAQGIFLDFKRLFIQNGSKLPLAVGQAGRSFRNEISPRQGLVRMREFNQMELEYFFNPNQPNYEGFEKISGEIVRVKPPAKKGAAAAIEEISLSEAISRSYFPNQSFAALILRCRMLYDYLGVPREKYHFRIMPKEETPHYSRGNVDIEMETSYGVIETAGIAYRTDYDLSAHAKLSGEDLSVFLQDEKARIVPHVIEPSLGVDRLFYSILEHSYRPLGQPHGWEWFAFKPNCAPYIAAIFPLMKKDGLDELAHSIEDSLREGGVDVYYSQSGSIGKRYARADEIGVPYCITVDYQTKEDGTVTLRFRDDGEQVRIKVEEIPHKLHELAKEGKTGSK